MSTLLGFIATKRPEEVITLSDGAEIAVQDALNTLQSAITAAADEAEEEQRDRSAVKAPIERASKALGELQRALDALPKARTFPEWDEATFAQKVAALEALTPKLKAAP